METPWRVKGRTQRREPAHQGDGPGFRPFYIDVPTTFSCGRNEPPTSVWARRVLAADEATGVLVMEDLDVGWRVGTPGAACSTL